MSNRRVTRRRFAALTTGTLASASLAGCLGDEDEEETEETDSADDGDDDSESETESFESYEDVDGSVSFATPTDGTETSASSVPFAIDVEGFELEEAGEVDDGADHLHVLIDTDTVEPGETIPTDDQHLHFGDGSAEGVLDLDPGEHTLHVQAADGHHVATDLTATIEIEVGDDEAVSFEAPEDGATVSGPVEVEMAAENFEIEEAGGDEQSVDAGHFHVLVDEDPVDVGEVIPSEDGYNHFGDGSAEGELELEPGEHTLHLQPGDRAHRAYGLTDTIEIEVEE